MKEHSSILLLAEDIWTKLQQMEQVNYLVYTHTKEITDMIDECLVVYAERKKKSALYLHDKGRHIRPNLISVLQASLVP